MTYEELKEGMELAFKIVGITDLKLEIRTGAQIGTDWDPKRKHLCVIDPEYQFLISRADNKWYLARYLPPAKARSQIFEPLGAEENLIEIITKTIGHIVDGKVYSALYTWWVIEKGNVGEDA